MGDLVAGLLQLHVHLVQQQLHLVLPVQDAAGLLVCDDVVLDLFLELEVQFLVLKDGEEALVDLLVEGSVVGDQLEVLLFEALFLGCGLFEFSLSHPDIGIETLQFPS